MATETKCMGACSLNELLNTIKWQ